jgi:hypothetical protein
MGGALSMGWCENSENIINDAANMVGTLKTEDRSKASNRVVVWGTLHVKHREKR